MEFAPLQQATNTLNTLDARVRHQSRQDPLGNLGPPDTAQGRSSRMDTLRSIFATVDMNGDDLLQLDEYRALSDAIRQIAIERGMDPDNEAPDAAFSQMDTDSDGNVSVDEWLTYFQPVMDLDEDTFQRGMQPFLDAVTRLSLNPRPPPPPPCDAAPPPPPPPPPLSGSITRAPKQDPCPPQTPTHAPWHAWRACTP